MNWDCFRCRVAHCSYTVLIDIGLSIVCLCGTVERELKMKTSKCVTIERNLYPHIHTNTKQLK